MAKRATKRKDGKPTRAERRAALRAQAQEIRESEADPRGTHRPLSTRPITMEDFDAIMSAIAHGDTATGICRELGVSMAQLYAMRDKDTTGELARRYAQAREHQAEAWADNIVDIAEEPVPVLRDSDGDPVPGASAGEIAHRNLRVNTKKWLMGKRNVKFSDKQTVALEGGDPARPIATKDVSEMNLQEMIGELQARHRSRTRVD